MFQLPHHCVLSLDSLYVLSCCSNDVGVREVSGLNLITCMASMMNSPLSLPYDINNFFLLLKLYYHYTFTLGTYPSFLLNIFFFNLFFRTSVAGIPVVLLLCLSCTVNPIPFLSALLTICSQLALADGLPLRVSCLIVLKQEGQLHQKVIINICCCPSILRVQTQRNYDTVYSYTIT